MSSLDWEEGIKDCNVQKKENEEKKGKEGQKDIRKRNVVGSILLFGVVVLYAKLKKNKIDIYMFIYTKGSSRRSAVVDYSCSTD